MAGSKSHSNQSLVPQPPSGTQGTSKLYSSFLQKQSAYEQHVQQQHKEAQANDLPDRTKQEPSAPLTARAEGGGVGTSKRIKTWNNEGFAAPVPLSARNSHLHEREPPAQKPPGEAVAGGRTGGAGTGAGEVENGERKEKMLPMTPAAAVRLPVACNAYFC